MQNGRDEVFKIVRGKLHELNEDLGYDFLAEISEDTPIYGAEYSIDSLALVRLAIELEEAINDRFDCDISLTDPEALANERNPYASVAHLIEFIIERLSGEG